VKTALSTRYSCRMRVGAELVRNVGHAWCEPNLGGLPV
jgi:hypothetical protein